MKKSVLVFGALFILSLFSCASLQEDIFVNSGANSLVFSSIEDLEDAFINIDCTYITQHKLNTTEVSTLLTQIDTSDTHMEPALKARLLALQGLLYLYQGRPSKANDIYLQAKGAQAGDSYVLMLDSRLKKSNTDQLDRLNTVLKIEPDDAVLNLEKAKVLYVMKKYDEALASIDKAFLILEKYNQENYRLGYAPLQENIWQMYKLSTNTNSNIPASDLQKNITVQNLVSYTVENSTLLNFFTAGAKYKTADLIKRLEKSGYLSAPVDQNNLDKTSLDITKSKTISRKMAARFLWNLYVQNKGKQAQLTKYSSRYAKLSTAKSPVADITLQDKDLDAVLGVIENEIMELPDGKNFNPDDNITVIEFIASLKAAEK
ncbi:MAG: hypothetical protein MR958_10305 [Spirochaetia bacterium]|nr:hypothetical protein [Spirochaetia bacterium]MDD7268501.1 hypothetical protein [Treponema sp.]MDY4985954.1 hypothetical protein [Treponema sp.]